MDYCQNLHMIAIGDTPREGKRIVVRLRCKMWTCEYCAETNRKMWRAKLIHHIHEVQGDWCWWTLTAHRYARGEQRSLANLRKAWDTLIKRMKRKYGAFSYARIYEQHEDKSYHIHAISSFHFDDIAWRIDSKTGEKTSYSRGLKKDAEDTSLGYYTHAANIETVEVHAGYVASYITKYIVKLSPELKQEFGRVRHIQTSQNWIVKDFSSVDSWQVTHGIYHDDVIGALVDKYEFIDVRNGHVVKLDDYADTYIYPPDFDHRLNSE